MEQNLKTEHKPLASEKTRGKSSRSSILAQTVKTGIIKSNLIPMWAGLTLGMYKNKMTFVDNIPEIIFSTIGSALVIEPQGPLIMSMIVILMRLCLVHKADQL